MHYCFLTTGDWERNASYVRLRELGGEMLKRGVRVSYVLADTRFNRQTLKLPEAAQVWFTPQTNLISQTIARRNILAQLNPDFVHVLNPYVKAFLALSLSKLKVVGDWDEWPMQRELPWAKKLLERFLDRWLRKRAAVIVVASRYLEREFATLGVNNATYIPYATYLAPQIEDAKPFAEPTAVYVGNFFPRYDHDLLFDAMKVLRDRNVRARLVLLGGEDDLDKWRTWVRENNLSDRIELPGFVTGGELWRHLRGAHVLLLPLRENPVNLARCPSKTYAYAQARRPIIANRTGEVPAVLGEKAIYVDATPAAFADAIDKVITAPRVADVDYHIESQNWAARADALLAALAGASRAR